MSNFEFWLGEQTKMIDKFMNWCFRWYTSKSAQQQNLIDTITMVCNAVFFFVVGCCLFYLWGWFVYLYSDLFFKALGVVAFCGLVIQVIPFLRLLEQRRKKRDRDRR